MFVTLTLRRPNGQVQERVAITTATTIREHAYLSAAGSTVTLPFYARDLSYMARPVDLLDLFLRSRPSPPPPRELLAILRHVEQHGPGRPYLEEPAFLRRRRLGQGVSTAPDGPPLVGGQLNLQIDIAAADGQRLCRDLGWLDVAGPIRTRQRVFYSRVPYNQPVAARGAEAEAAVVQQGAGGGHNQHDEAPLPNTSALLSSSSHQVRQCPSWDVGQRQGQGGRADSASLASSMIAPDEGEDEEASSQERTPSEPRGGPGPSQERRAPSRVVATAGNNLRLRSAYRNELLPRPPHTPLPSPSDATSSYSSQEEDEEEDSDSGWVERFEAEMDAQHRLLEVDDDLHLTSIHGTGLRQRPLDTSSLSSSSSSSSSSIHATSTDSSRGEEKSGWTDDVEAEIEVRRRELDRVRELNLQCMRRIEESQRALFPPSHRIPGARQRVVPPSYRSTRPAPTEEAQAGEEEEEEERWPICLQALYTTTNSSRRRRILGPPPARMRCCGRGFHGACIGKWICVCHQNGAVATCPTCVAPIFGV